MKRTGDDYFDSKEFREMLESYEEAISEGQPVLMDPDELTDIADYYHYMGMDEQADDAIGQASALNPGATGPLLYKTRQQLEIGDIEGAEYFLDQILDKSDPNYQYMQGEVLIAQDEIEEADRLFRDYFRDVPPEEHADFVMDVANIWYDYGVFDKAQQWMMRSPGDDSPDFKELMAQILFALGKTKDSERLFNELLDYDPYSVKYWKQLATNQIVNDHNSEAIESIGYALAIDPNEPESILIKANGLYHQNNFQEALRNYEHFNELQPGYDYVELQIGTCLYCMRRNDEAIEHFERARELTCDDSIYTLQIHQELAFAYSYRGDVQKAMSCLDELKDVNCYDEDVLVMRGYVMLENQRPEEAEEYFRQAIEQAESAPKALLKIIVSFLDNGYTKAAYTLFKQFLKYAPDDYDEGFSYMALCCWRLQKYKEFMKYLKLAVERNPHEARMVLDRLFPDEMEPADYYDYIKNKLER
jgi:tetratricopeptide (TPR) repeat protein